MQLVDDWRDWWRWASTYGIAALGAVPLVWAQIPGDVKGMIPDTIEPWLPLLFAAAVLAGRLKKQRKSQ